MQLRAARGRLLDEDRVARQPLGQRGEHVAGAQRLAGRGRRRRIGAAQRRRRRRRRALDRARERGADRGRVAEHGELDRAAVRLGRVLRDDRHARALAHERPGVEGVLAQRAGADHEHDVVGPSISRSRERRAGRCPANCGWSCGKPAAPPNGSWKTGQARRSASARSAAQPAALSAPAPATIAGALGVRHYRGERVDRRRVGPAERSERTGPSVSCGSGAGASQSSIGTITIAGPRPVTASW